ncbi:hypothetical protein F5Y10DRAFT_111843 [Nemania abortiva]|nr:hypothetical protein F5Y10DRAFT_111843 [Nemania abortiva]
MADDPAEGDASCVRPLPRLPVEVRELIWDAMLSADVVVWGVHLRTLGNRTFFWPCISKTSWKYELRVQAAKVLAEVNWETYRRVKKLWFAPRFPPPKGPLEVQKFLLVDPDIDVFYLSRQKIHDDGWVSYSHSEADEPNLVEIFKPQVKNLMISLERLEWFIRSLSEGHCLFPSLERIYVKPLSDSRLSLGEVVPLPSPFLRDEFPWVRSIIEPLIPCSSATPTRLSGAYSEHFPPTSNDVGPPAPISEWWPKEYQPNWSIIQELGLICIFIYQLPEPWSPWKEAPNVKVRSRFYVLTTERGSATQVANSGEIKPEGA